MDERDLLKAIKINEEAVRTMEIRLEAALDQRDAWGRTHQEDVAKIEDLERRLEECQRLLKQMSSS